MADERVRSLEEAEQHVRSLAARLDQAESMLFKHNRMFVVLQTPLWKRIVFRLDGWPGQVDLDRKKPHWRPWHRWWLS